MCLLWNFIVIAFVALVISIPFTMNVLLMSEHRWNQTLLGECARTPNVRWFIMSWARSASKVWRVHQLVGWLALRLHALRGVPVVMLFETLAHSLLVNLAPLKWQSTYQRGLFACVGCAKIKIESQIVRLLIIEKTWCKTRRWKIISSAMTSQTRRALALTGCGCHRRRSGGVSRAGTNLSPSMPTHSFPLRFKPDKPTQLRATDAWHLLLINETWHRRHLPRGVTAIAVSPD